MKKVSISAITTGAAAKIKSGTLQHIQDGPKEAIAEAIKAMIGESYDASKYYILYGCVNTGSGLNYIISAGAVFYSDEVYITPALTFTAAGGEVARFSTVITYTTATNYDPVDFTDGSSANIHRDTTGTWVSAVSTSNPLEYAFMVRVSGAELNLTLTANYSTGGGLTPKVGMTGNVVSFSGAILCGAGATTIQTIFTLAPEFRPMQTKVFSFVITDAGGNFKNVYMTITTAGVCQVANATGGAIATYYIYLDGLNYKI